MKKIIIVAIVLFLTAYLTISFIFLSPYPNEWGVIGRGLYVALLLVVLYFIDKNGTKDSDE